MKNGNTGKPSAAELERLKALPDVAIGVEEDEPYDPHDPTAVTAYWKNAVAVKQGGIPAIKAGLVKRVGQRGPGKKPRKILLSVRYSPEVIEYFKATGEGWQARMDAVLLDYVRTHRE